MDINLDIDWALVLGELAYNPKSPMIFSSGLFLWLFAIFSLIYFCLCRTAFIRILFVTLFSYYFYYKSSGVYVVLLFVVTISDFLLAKVIYRLQMADGVRMIDKRRGWQRLFLTMSLMVNLGFLGYFKYTNFFYEMYCQFTEGRFEALDIFLPVGISFFTFQSISYVVSIYRGQLQALNNPLDYAFYVSFFPQLVAGPIVDARDFVPQIHKPLIVTDEMFGRGVFLIVAGLFKKAVISDYISVNFVERIFDNPTLYSGIENLLGLYGYALQIYCDFSGYSDMAIGIALLLGFKFPDNFNSPYKSTSVTEFWRRWHISLSHWLRDHLYISLGGNRHGKLRTYFNLFMTMLLGGFWHGASWNFIVWGALHGLALGVHKAFRSVLHIDPAKRATGLMGILARLLTFHFVVFCWIFFRNTSFENSWHMIEKIALEFNPELFPQIWDGYTEVMCLIVFGFILHFLPDSMTAFCQRAVTKLPLILKAVLLTAVIFLIIQVKSSDIQPFIYFQF
jgi:D-alanyl-lipoteichoic acid acyltransferase DltB (MBOAT superfamily)